MKSNTLIIFFICFVILLPTKVQAFRLTPMNLMLDKEKISEYMTVENGPQETKVALELTATERHHDESGKENRIKTQDIKIFPNQFFLAPGEKRRVKITYQGNMESTSEKAYRIIAEQLPVEEADKKNSTQSGINILLKYVAAVYFRPNTCESTLKLENVKSRKGNLIFVLKNVGNCHHLIKNPSVELFVNSKSFKVLQAEELKPIIGENILANSTREFKISFKEKIAEKLTGTFQDNP